MAFLAALAVAAGPCGLPPLAEGARPFEPGESLAFDVDLLGVVKAGSLTLAVEPPMSRGALLPLRARVRNNSVFAKVRRVRAYALSWVDSHTLRPERYRDEAEEDGVRKSTDTRLDRPGPVNMAWTLGDQKGTTTLEKHGEMLDLVSTLYYLRAAHLRAGQEMCFDMVANRRFWRLRGAVVAGTEVVDTPAGRFDTVRIDAELSRADGKGPKRAVHLWFSTDARRLPVAVVGELDLGPVRAMLSRVSGPAVEPVEPAEGPTDPRPPAAAPAPAPQGDRAD
jgi:hypothetical protein